MAVFSSPVDAGFRYTSGFSRSRTLGGKTAPHAGSDYAPPTPNQRGTKARAVAAGTVVAIGTGVLAGHSGKIVVINHGIVGGDKTITNYGHLDSIAVKKGQRVSAGTIIGTVGSTGRVTGVHLHFGVRFNGVYHDPHAWLGRKGIVPGRTAPIRPEARITPASTTTVLKSRTETTLASLGVKHVLSVRTIQQRLKTMGYTILVDGVDGTETRKVIAEYQKTQKSPYTLYADGVWGHRTEAHYKWTVALQTTINKWKSDYRKLSADGHYGANTVAYVRNVQKRNYGGKYKGAVDGIPGRVFCRMIGITTHP